ncbi:MAG TPA: flagellin, partial [Syntrophorhabdaceae bacterium]|nr:flagellin [Syntrophorhabdaceae bacterium]
TIDTAVTNLNTERGKIGAAQNQITYHLANLEAMYENTKAAESTIKDADFAAEMANFTKFQIVTQSGVAMLAQANQLPQLILSLMR